MARRASTPSAGVRAMARSGSLTACGASAALLWLWLWLWSWPSVCGAVDHVYFHDSSGRRPNDSPGAETKPGPRPADEAQDRGPAGRAPETVSAVSGDGRWRVLLNPGPDGLSTVVTLPFGTADGATSKLLSLNAALLAVTIVGLLALGRWVVRPGLMPLTGTERTARDATAGRLDLRSPDPDPRTETPCRPERHPRPGCAGWSGKGHARAGPERRPARCSPPAAGRSSAGRASLDRHLALLGPADSADTHAAWPVDPGVALSYSRIELNSAVQFVIRSRWRRPESLKEQPDE